jgi:hypothetical protein
MPKYQVTIWKERSVIEAYNVELDAQDKGDAEWKANLMSVSQLRALDPMYHTEDGGYRETYDIRVEETESEDA